MDLRIPSHKERDAALSAAAGLPRGEGVGSPFPTAAFLAVALALKVASASEVHTQKGHTTTRHGVETWEFLTKEPMPCSHMPLLM